MRSCSEAATRAWVEGVQRPLPSPVVLAYLSAAASLVNKSVYLGEFGDTDPGPRPFTRAMLAQLAQLGTPRATVWV